MTIQVCIPDDYQLVTTGLDCLQNLPQFHCTAVGDISRDSGADDALASAQALILIRERTTVDDAFLQRTPNLKLISQTGKIARNIDLAACSRAGVAVVEGVGSPVAPAELTWLLIMAARRKFVQAVNAMRAGHWQAELGQGVHNQRLGILGYGKIGKRIAAYANAFGMQVQVWGSDRARQEAQQEGLIVPASREAFFATSDVITVHQRLVAETQGNVTLVDLLQMKPDALFVNTSRAELVAADALLSALQQGHPGFAALDVFEAEPIYDPAHPLLSMSNVLCTPHIGYVEKDSYRLYFKTAFDNVVRFFEGDTSHVINPDVRG
ncbi:MULTISPECIES: D-2-hydroxyacid dehydrogenase family protein [Pantoea]|uniref:D-2-hydroxyacid dehydrogenase family protein n=1 Tax=Pantoea TaxID=53335 RepID=UPI0007C76C0E|nr:MULTISPECIES: D-2-hydroxyacid dehydrogenase family protein [Pantoea]MBW1251751.1 D-2-hydroxyacid dehydrogenase family protein [Pantoea allii]MBW1260348.1 D-2-hydroxyacid dehydrogenase family protein [Pantoea allii]MBW1282945.1 D-2-hydroxyacid dehydrogenase family protein [Pantoea allii]OAE08156.1 3-phosphoglycerate dehydrogenase [Pantoea sp. OXWO6B1]ORM88966.1 3-phosphoglycerate dehydrogenase [Pantoea allii]